MSKSIKAFLFNKPDPQRFPLLLRYGAALFFAYLAIVLRISLKPYLGEQIPFLLSLFAVTLSGYFGGFGPGMLATVAGIFDAMLCFFEPPLSLFYLNAGEQVMVSMFIALGTVISAMNEALHRSYRDAKENLIIAKKSQDQMELVLAGITDCYYKMDRDFQILEINDKACEFLLRPRSAFIGKTMWECMPETVGSVLEIAFLKAMKSMQPVHFEYESKLTAGRFMEVHVQPSESGVAVYFRDVSERNVAMEKTKRSAQQLQIITDQVPVMVSQLDKNRRYVFVNRACEEYFEKPKSQNLAREMSDFMTPEEFQKIEPLLNEAFGGEMVQFDMKVPGFKLERELRVSYCPAKDETGKVYSVVILAMDVTTEKRATEERAKLLHAEHEARMEAEKARTEAERANRAKDHFLAALSHELRTPLTPVLLCSTMFSRNEALSPEVRDAFEMITRNVRLEVRLIDDLLDLTRIAQKKIAMQPKPTDVHDILRKGRELCLTGVSHERKVEIVLELTATESTVWGDEARLEQVVWNLLNNAMKFTPDGGRILIRTYAAKDNAIAVEVSDSGVGINQGVLPQIFDAFEQGGPDITPRFGGLGLGLAISKSFVEMHGGRIWAESAGQGQGSVFTFELDTIPASASSMRSVKNSQPAIAPVGLVILVIEDHEYTAQMLSQILGKKHTIKIAHRCSEAREILESQKFDLLISDVGLPDGSGFDLMREAKNKFGSIGIAMSGYGMPSDIATSKKSGFAEHLVKPIDIVQLEAAIGRVTSGS